MRSRWFLLNRRYLSISVTISGPDVESQESNVVLIADISIRPLFAWHCASIWSAPVRCGNFVILRTSFARFEFHSDHFETDEIHTFPEPAPTPLLDFADAIRRQCVRAAVLNWTRSWFGA